MKSSVRRLSAADLDAILAIQRECPEAAQWRAEEWGIFIVPDDDAHGKKVPARHCAWVAEANGAAIGFLAGLFTGEEVEILNLAVAPGARRAGVASRVLEEALAAARSEGTRRAFLEVRASNAGAVAFYERNGFLPVARRKEYYAAPVEDALVLSRGIDADQ